MGKKLVIVESPAKAKTIGRYLGDDYRITASVGHIRDLPSGSLGVDVNNNFAPRYINMKGKDKVIRELKEYAAEADSVLIATDPDREGEAIAWHIATLLKVDPADKARISFNEITEKAVQDAVIEPRSIDMDLVNAQQARRILDRLVGYELSPLLWKKIRKGLSAGRVQSVATRMLVEREEAINAFVPKEYWNLVAMLSTENKEAFKAFYHGKINEKDKLEKVKLDNKEMADEVIQEIEHAAWSVRTVKKGQKKRQPFAPFTTSTLQQEAAKRLGFTSKRTMSVAQQLYEGVEVPGVGPTALVTYIRTDSMRVSAEAQAAAKDLIISRYGEKYLPGSARLYKNKNAAQDAHEAIRPAHFEYGPEKLQNALSSDQYKLYKLIWERFLASQMSAAVIDTLVVDTQAGKQIFRSTGETVVFMGFLAAYADIVLDNEEKTDVEDPTENKQSIPPLKEKQILNLDQLLPEQKFTLPPARYTEASLIKAMEEEGIGRPSTYAPTISTILARDYAKKEKRQLVPTNLGFVTTQLLRDNFNNVINTKFTALMEDKLDNVEQGEQVWTEVVREFYFPFHDLIEDAQLKVEKVQMPVVKTGEICPDCEKGELLIKEGRYGKFIACSNFPDCKYTRNIVEKTGAHCPLCGADVITRKSKRGSIFYLCSKDAGDADCKFISWDVPIDGENCENCGSYMVMKRFRGRTYPKCSNADCVTNHKKTTKKTETADEEKPADAKLSEDKTADNSPGENNAPSKSKKTTKKAAAAKKPAVKKTGPAKKSKNEASQEPAQ